MAKLLPLAAKTEILVNGTWTNITSFVYLRDPIAITGGSTMQGDTAQPAQMTLTLDNSDGRFSPNYSGGAYFPYLKQAVQIRVSVNATSSSGNTYNGYRFWGSVKTWPPLSDISGHDRFVQITANGPLRTLQTHGGKGSALTRYYSLLLGTLAPVAYWPCEEDSDNTTLIGAGISGSAGMTVTGTPKFRAVSNFNGSHPIGVLNKSIWDGLTGSFGASGNDIFNAPGTYQWIAATSAVDARVWGGGGGGYRGSIPFGGATGGSGGGGGEFAREAALAVTPGQSYTVIVGAGGQGVDASDSGPADQGLASSIAGNSVTVTANGGGGAQTGTGSGSRGIGGTGSVNTTHFSGGDGNWPSTTGTNGGRGNAGGSSAGTAAGGTGNLSDTRPANVAPSGGGDSGAGGNVTVQPYAGYPGVTPGGGGGGGSAFGGTVHSAGDGAPGQVQLIYTPPAVPTTNVIRFILFVPDHGGNPGKVLLRALTSSAVIARLDVTYVAGGKLRLQGFDGSSVQKFDSGAQSWGADGQTLMVSVEMLNSGANIAWAFKSIIPGQATLNGSASGTVTTAAVGNVSEVIAGPNADITRTAMGHISVQYGLISLRKVSKALDGHHQEMGIDRFIRLANEQAMSAIPAFSETNDHWGFETGTQSWVGTNAALTNPTTTFTPVDTDTTPNLTLFPMVGQAQAWPPDGTHSLLLTCNGSANPFATSPTGTSGQPVSVGDIVSVNCEVYTPAAKNNMFIGILWYQTGGTACAHPEDDSADSAFAAGEMKTLRVTATAPTAAARFAVKIGDHETPANGQLIYVDNVRVHPRMGPQTRNELHEFMKEIKDLDQGIMKDAKTLWGLGYRTRISLINQSPALTLNYAAGTISPPLEPVVDDKNIQNDITVKRHKGGKVQVTLNNGQMSILEPPAGTGRKKKHLKVAAEKDEQLAALAAQLLGLGTASDERYPTVTVNLARAGITGNAVAPLMSAVAGMEIGDYLQITNLPFWFPASTAKQLIIGYNETISAYEWIITWNCTPESPYEITVTSLRRW